MITKKKILLHALWGGIFGLLSAIIVGYGDTYGGRGIYDFLNYLSYKFHLGVDTHWFPRPVPVFIQQYLVFLIPGVFLGLALGVADRSIKKIFYGIIGGLVGGLIFYVIYPLLIKSIAAPSIFLVLFFSPMIYVIFICFTFGIIDKSFLKAVKGIIGGIIALLVISPLIFFLFIVYGLGGEWSLGNVDVLGNVIASLLIGFTLFGISLTTGVFIGTELGKKKI